MFPPHEKDTRRVLLSFFLRGLPFQIASFLVSKRTEQLNFLRGDGEKSFLYSSFFPPLPPEHLLLLGVFPLGG